MSAVQWFTRPGRQWRGHAWLTPITSWSRASALPPWNTPQIIEGTLLTYYGTTLLMDYWFMFMFYQVFTIFCFNTEKTRFLPGMVVRTMIKGSCFWWIEKCHSIELKFRIWRLGNNQSNLNWLVSILKIFAKEKSLWFLEGSMWSLSKMVAYLSYPIVSLWTSLGQGLHRYLKVAPFFFFLRKKCLLKKC